MVNELDLFDPFKKKKGIDSLMEDFFEPMRMPVSSGIRSPLVDIVDKGKFLRVTAELPGIEKKDIDLNILDDRLAIRAEIKHEKKEEKKDSGYFFHERSYSSFSRQLPLPSPVVPEKAKADFSNGILHIDLPKKHVSREARKPVRLKVR
ncbi:MAG TPA: Hsp20/alpha crystallin family protein [archaeon]|nr:Hsp20/alpha crystallin family protein [archaeon]